MVELDKAITGLHNNVQKTLLDFQAAYLKKRVFVESNIDEMCCNSLSKYKIKAGKIAYRSISWFKLKESCFLFKCSTIHLMCVLETNPLKIKHPVIDSQPAKPVNVLFLHLPERSAV